MTGLLNMRWARILIDQLIQHNITYFCVAPGSRSTPLALAIAEHPQAKGIVHFDERGVCFHALGYAKAARKAAVVLTSSGTAVGNLFPAVMEAHNERIPLILLTADRPPELRASGANQTCDQVKLFSDYVRWQFDFPCPTSDIPERFLATSIAQAVHQAHANPAGPVHLNCMFRKPLFSIENEPTLQVTPTRIEPVHNIPSSEQFALWASLLTTDQEGIIVVGSLPSEQPIEPILALAAQLKWPVLPDILSQVRTQAQAFEIIAYYDALLKAHTDFKPQIILHFGDRIVSKTLKYWLAGLSFSHYLHVSDHSWRQDPHHLVTRRLSCDPTLFCQKILPLLAEKTKTDWFDAWKTPSEEIDLTLQQLFAQEPQLTEPYVVRILQERLSPNWALFIGSSMPIRDMDQFFFPDQPIGPLFGNRGVSGIDGNIATAIGIAQGCQKPTIALLGDLAALHDINSLAQLKSSAFPILLIVINNQGGGIFSFLPIAEKKTVFEKFFATAHPYTFEGAAQLFQIPYACFTDKVDLEKWLSTSMHHPQSTIIEIQTERAYNYQFHQSIAQAVKKCLMNCCI
jgi:2-succinyl-5-enolpyruvyl-6-hydroxy-3-cyclohexene-1-carboxylate synthase